MKSKTLETEERKALPEAAELTPKGFILWATYATHEEAVRTKKLFGAPDDVIIGLPKSGRWALYGREA